MFNFIDTHASLLLSIPKIMESGIISLDTECTSLDVFSAKLLLLQLCLEDGSLIVIDCTKINITYLIQVLKDSNKLILGHNIKFDLEIIYLNCKELLFNTYDTMIGEVLINQGIGKQLYSLKELVEKYEDIILDKDIRNTFESFDNTKGFTQEQLIYSALDVKYLLSIYKKQLEKLTEQKQLNTLDVESRLTPHLTMMELNGVSLDTEHWLKLKEIALVEVVDADKKLKEYIISRINFKKSKSCLDAADKFGIPIKKTKKEIEELGSITNSEYIKKWVECNINLASPQQVKKILNLLDIPVESTGEKILEVYKNNEFVSKLLNLREYNKKLTTYGEKFLENLNPVTGKLHVSYNQVGTATGRFSASRVHQIPRDANYRKAFIASPGYLFLTADFNQEEYRLAGAITGDRNIIDSYLAGKDMHTATASLVYKVGLNDVTKAQRDRAKSLNFSTLYGSTAYGLQFNLGISLGEAEEIIEILEKGYPRFIAFRDAICNKVWENKFSTTPIGRKRFFKEKEIYRDSQEFRTDMNRVRRAGFNHIIQGCGGDVIKEAMIGIGNNNPFGDNLRMLIQVHDEIDLEAREDIVDDAVPFVKEQMEKAEQVFLGEIPALVDIEVAKYWKK